jgi:hypothetical protein
MAEIRTRGEQVLVQLNLAEKVGALHRNLHFPRLAVRAVRIVDNPFAQIQGIRSPGTRIPGVIALGTWRRGGARDFVAVYRGQGGVVIDVDPSQASYARLILSTKDPEHVQGLLPGAI